MLHRRRHPGLAPALRHVQLLSAHCIPGLVLQALAQPRSRPPACRQRARRRETPRPRTPAWVPFRDAPQWDMAAMRPPQERPMGIMETTARLSMRRAYYHSPRFPRPARIPLLHSQIIGAHDKCIGRGWGPGVGGTAIYKYHFPGWLVTACLNPGNRGWLHRPARGRGLTKG